MLPLLHRADKFSTEHSVVESVMVISVGAGGVGWCLSKSVYTVIGKNSIGGDCCGNIQKHCCADLQYGLQKSACKP